MTDLDLIDQLGGLLGRPLDVLSEERFERHAQAKYARDGGREQITRDAYCLGADGTVSGLFLQPVTSELLSDFPLHQFSQVRHLSLHRVNLKSYAFLSELKGLATLDLSSNEISDCSFLRGLKGLATLDLSYNLCR